MARNRKDLDRLEPFRRGDHQALILVVLGALLFAGGTIASFTLGLVSWGELSLELRALNVLSLLLASFAFFWSVAKDWWWLHKEERDIQFVLHEGRHHAELVLLKPKERSTVLARTGQKDANAGAALHEARTRAMAAPRVETLIDDRVLRVSRLAGESEEGLAGGAIREAEMRALALSRSAGVGGAARYVSGLLLLLTVLGTFVGVKSALPALIGALDVASGGGEAASAATQMQRALGGVAGAFGSNLNALVAAIALGVAAFGLNAGRQSMLARLEQASSLYLYPHLGRGAATSHFTAALQKLGDASGNLGGIAAHLEGLGTSIQELSRSVDVSLGNTTDTLQSILRQQQEQVRQESRQAVDKVERQLTETLLSVHDAASLYEVIAGTLAERNEGFTEASAGLHMAVRELAGARGAFATYADSATRTLDTRLKEVELAGRRQASMARRTFREHERIRVSLGDLLSETRRLATSLRDAEEGRRMALQGFDTAVAEAVAVRLGAIHREFEVSLATIPDRVSKGVEAAVRDLIETDRASREGAAPAPIDLRVLERIALALDALERRLGDERPPPIPDTLARLDTTLQALERSLSRTLWQRLAPWGRSAAQNGAGR